MWSSLAERDIGQKTKPGQEENPRAGHTRPRPFSNLFYVACKPAGSNDHGIKRFIRRARLCVKPAVGLDRGWSCRVPPSEARTINSDKECDLVALSFAPSDQGILPDRMIAALERDGAIVTRYPFAADQIQPASLDLRLGAIAYRVRASFLPGPGTTVAERIGELKLHEFSLADGAVLETNCVYIVPLIESLALPADIAAMTNPKSSTGRLDVFTRVIADEHPRLRSRRRRLSRPALRRDQSRRLSRSWSAKARGCRNYACAAATRRSAPRRCARCMRANGWSTGPRR